MAPVFALAQATRAELTRRPGLLLSCVAVGALLLVLHDLSSTAFDTTGALARELTFSTIGLVLALLGGIAGARAGSAEEELGPTAEILASPAGPLRYVCGRFLGICQANAVFLAILLVFALLAFARAGDLGGMETAWTIAGGFLGAALFVTIGIVWGLLVPLPLAVLLVLFTLIAARLWIPALAAAGDGLASLSLLIPDPARLDLAREAGFGRPVSLSSMGLAWASAILQTAGMLLLAATLLEKRRH